MLIPGLNRDREWIPILPLEENPNFHNYQKQRYFEETALRTFQIFTVVNCLSSTVYFISHFL